MEKLCVRKIEKLDNTLIEEFTDALSCLAGQLVTISEGFSEDYYRLLEELKEAFAQNDVVSTIDNEVISVSTSSNLTCTGKTAIFLALVLITSLSFKQVFFIKLLISSHL